MTRLPDPPDRPAVVRVVSGGTRGDLVAMLTGRVLVLRPKRSRRPESTVTVTWQGVYERALLAQAPHKRSRNKVSRGVL